MLQKIETLLGVLGSVPVNAESVEKLYNFVAKSKKANKLGLDLRAKSVNHTKTKRLQVKKKARAFLNLFSVCL